MRICCLGYIHYYGLRKVLDDIASSVEDERVNVDVIMLVGDLTANGDLNLLVEVLEVIKEVTIAPILVIPGNHDLYVMPEEWGKGVNSLLKLQLFNSLTEKLGYIPLMKAPYIIDGVGFVGSIAWYDYSFAPEWLNLSIEAYREKAFGLSIWADREFIKLPFSDDEFTLMPLERFEEQVKHVYDSVEKIIVVLHHVPFRELVHYKLRPEWDYFSTFMGSEAFGHVIRKYKDKVRLVLHGHQHNGVEAMVCREVEGIKCCNCASPVPVILNI